MPGLRVYRVKRLNKYYDDKTGGANCKTPNYTCQINPDTSRCKAMEGSEDSENCICYETKSGWRCKNRNTGHVSTKAKKSLTKKKRGKVSPPPKPELKRNKSDDQSSAWEKVLSEYRDRDERIRTHEDRENAFQRYTQLMRQPMNYWAGQPEIQSLAEALGISISVVEENEHGDFYVIPHGIMNRTELGPQDTNVAVFYNGDNHYMRFQPSPEPHNVIAAGEDINGEVIDVPGDGDCFYTSLFEGLRHTRDGRAILRQHNIRNTQDLRILGAEHMWLYRERFSDFFYPEGSDSDDE